jgi:hypothetical protein
MASIATLFYLRISWKGPFHGYKTRKESTKPLRGLLKDTLGTDEFIEM